MRILPFLLFALLFRIFCVHGMQDVEEVNEEITNWVKDKRVISITQSSESGRTYISIYVSDFVL
jgi:hypothetical protein